LGRCLIVRNRDKRHAKRGSKESAENKKMHHNFLHTNGTRTYSHIPKRTTSFRLVRCPVSQPACRRCSSTFAPRGPPDLQPVAEHSPPLGLPRAKIGSIAQDMVNWLIDQARDSWPHLQWIRQALALPPSTSKDGPALATSLSRSAEGLDDQSVLRSESRLPQENRDRLVILRFRPCNTHCDVDLDPAEISPDVRLLCFPRRISGKQKDTEICISS
jgi:hypothetical protein